MKLFPHFLFQKAFCFLNLYNTYDIVLDCTDNVATRYLLNDACILSGKPLVSGSALRFEGQVSDIHVLYQGNHWYLGVP